MNDNSSKSVICQFVALMKCYDIRHVVVCPGSRNAPIVHTLASQEWLTCYPVTDERSAAFVAIGLSDMLSAETGRREAVAVCCTSGSAVLNMAPAVAEAHYRNVPLLVISADRPEAWIGQMDGQTLPQPKCFGEMALSYVLREGDDEEIRWYRNRVVNEAMSQLMRCGGQPVHVNIHLSEPLFTFVESELPKERMIVWQERANSSCGVEEGIFSESKRIVVVVGQTVHSTKQIEPIISSLIADKRAVVIAENLSNITRIDGVIRNIDDIILSGTVDEAMVPDAVVYVGGHIVSKRLKQYIRRIVPKVCIRVTDSQHLEDTFMCMTHQYGMAAFATICQMMSKGEESFYDRWQSVANSVQSTTGLVERYTAYGVVAEVLSRMPKECYLSLANSSSVRLAQGIALDNVVFCNRGVNGIDGSLSAAVGQALATDKIVLSIIGDLSFLYDMNALWNVQLPANLRVLLLNNGGGEIFKTLPGLEKSVHRDRYVMAQHTTTVGGWVADARCQYIQITSADEMTVAIDKLFAREERCVVVEVMM